MPKGMAKKWFTRVCACGCGIQFSAANPGRILRPECRKDSMQKQQNKLRKAQLLSDKEKDERMIAALNRQPIPVGPHHLQRATPEQFVKLVRKLVRQ